MLSNFDILPNQRLYNLVEITVINGDILKIGSNTLIPHWIALWLTAFTLVFYLIIAHRYGHELWQPLPDSQRIVVRTIFYALCIIGFPLTNLLRHILLRLNQTMPGKKPAGSRYMLTVIVSFIFAEGVGLFGIVMYMLGDDFNTLYIFMGLSALALYLYRPKYPEYKSIIEELSEQKL